MNKRSKLIYSGQHYHSDREDHLKQEPVTFKWYKNKVKEKHYVIQVGNQARTFKEEELCFFDCEEIELNIQENKKDKKGFICLNQKTLEECSQNFLCLSVVIYKIGDKDTPCMYPGSNRIKLFDRVNPGKNCVLWKLEQQLRKYFGQEMNQWFMYRVCDNNNEQPVRIILRKSNFSVLDDQLRVLHYHSLEKLEFQEFLINPSKRLISMKIRESNKSEDDNQVQEINLRSSWTGEDKGYSFRTSLCSNLHEIHHEKHYGIRMDIDTKDSRIIKWVSNIRREQSIEDDSSNASLNLDLPYPHLEFESPNVSSLDQNMDLNSNPSEQEGGNDIHNFSSISSHEQTNVKVPYEHDEGASHCQAGSCFSSQNSCNSSDLPIPHKMCNQNIGDITSCENSENFNDRQRRHPVENTWSENESFVQKNPPCCSSKLPKRHLLRSESIDELSLYKMNGNKFNENDSKRNSGSSYDDNEYQRIYYKNTGWIRCRVNRVQMPQRIRRQRHMDFNIPDVDFEVVNRHEDWWDNDYRYKADVQLHDRNHDRSCPVETQYWNGDLCITVQLFMERKCPLLQSGLDLTWNQLLAVIVHLSVDTQPACFKKNWKDLAELIGLSIGDIEIIHHFCITYREWPTRVVLCHWKLLSEKGRNVPKFNFYHLRLFLVELGRNDILKIVDYSDTNCLENKENSRVLM